MTDVQWVVRVRIPRANAWPSPPMSRSEAVSAAAALRALIRDEGDGPGFIEFEANGRRLIHIRAREVLSVEADQWKSRTPEAGAGIPVDGIPDDNGLGFLRHQSDRSRQPIVR